MTALFYADSAGLERDVFDRWLARISPFKAERLQRIKWDDAKASMTGELLLRYGLWKTFGIAPDTVKTAVNDLGKPYLISHPDLYFNVSHTGSRCICAVGDCPLGVDIEEVREIRHEKLANRYFTAEELASYYSLGGDENAFFTLWTRKEAFGKLTGRGLRPGAEENDGHILFEKSFQNCKICLVGKP